MNCHATLLSIQTLGKAVLQKTNPYIYSGYIKIKLLLSHLLYQKKRLLIKHHSYIKVKSEGSKEKADTENEKIGRKQNNTSKKIF